VARAQADCDEHRGHRLTDDLRCQPADRRLRLAHRRAVAAVSRPPGAAGAAPLVEPGIFARRFYTSSVLFSVVFVASMGGIVLIFKPARPSAG